MFCSDTIFNFCSVNNWFNHEKIHIWSVLGTLYISVGKVGGRDEGIGVYQFHKMTHFIDHSPHLFEQTQLLSNYAPITHL